MYFQLILDYAYSKDINNNNNNKIGTIYLDVGKCLVFCLMNV